MFKYLILLYIALVSLPLYSQLEGVDAGEIYNKLMLDLNSSEKVSLEKELQVQKILFEGAEKVKLAGLEYESIEEATSTLERTIQDILERRSHLFINPDGSLIKETQRKSISKVVKSLFTKRKIKEILKTSRRTIINKLKFVQKGAKSFLRTKGIGLTLAYLIGQSINLGVPAIIMPMGYTTIGKSILAFPVSTVVMGGYVGIENVIKRKKLIKRLGGKEKMAFYDNLTKELKNKYRISNKYSVIDFKSAAGEKYIMSIKNQGFKTKVLDYYGANKNLTPASFDKFLIDEQIFPKLRVELLDKKISPYERMLIIVDEIAQSDEPKHLESFRGKFSKSIAQVDGVPAFSSQRKWAIRASMSKTYAELFAHMSVIPDDLPPSSLDVLWREFILPGAGENIKLENYADYSSFRSMYDDFIDLRKGYRELNQLGLDEVGRENFLKYLLKAMPEKESCNII
ncbi:MAG: hypothetical protein ACI9QD_000960, partial [Thermoproteota archaeon]